MAITQTIHKKSYFRPGELDKAETYFTEKLKHETQSIQMTATNENT